jgi:glycerol-3-phosphate O-acyltransferase/dihydroxyacetone phosphate acyltransferase
VLKKILGTYLHLGIRVFFRHIEVEGRERVPLQGPLIIAPNHLNAFVDPLVIQAVLPRELTITAKNTLSNNWLYGMLMRIGGVVTFHRQQDWGKGAEMTANAETVAECRRRLEGGEALCIFPEGISHSDPAMRRFKTGTARIALDYARSDGGPFPLQILPVGQVYEAKEHFRSRVLIRFGEPIDVRAWAAGHPETGRRQLAKELTWEMESRVKALTLNFARRRDAILADWAAQVLLADRGNRDPLDGSETTLSERTQLAQRLQESLTSLRVIERKVLAHRAALRKLDLTPGEVGLLKSNGRVAAFVLREVILALAGLPIAIWGVANNLLAYLALRWTTAWLATSRDLWASSAVYASLVVLPLVYVLQTGLVWAAFSGRAAALYALLLPPTGFLSVLYAERLARSWRRFRVCARLLRQPDLQDRLQRENRALAEELQTLGEGLNAPFASPHFSHPLVARTQSAARMRGARSEADEGVSEPASRRPNERNEVDGPQSASAAGEGVRNAG